MSDHLEPEELFECIDQGGGSVRWGGTVEMDEMLSELGNVDGHPSD